MSINKGIGEFASHYFVEQNELRRRGEKYTGPRANTTFRLEVCCKLVEEFGISLSAAGAHYNNALKLVRDATPELVSGLGRPPEKNNGGRKKKAKAEAGAQGVTREQVLANMLAALPAAVSDVQESTMLSSALFPAMQAELEEAST